MVLECRLCNKVKKFGEWIEATSEFKELVKEVGAEVVRVVCPQCEEGVLSVLASRELVKQA
ncbi:MAG TPA: hypothetical protein ACFYEM_04215 [Candidatus Hypogeohydataceae bacterium YC40]